MYPHQALCFRPKPPTWNIPTNDEHHRSPPVLSYLYHVVLGIHEVDHLVHTVTEDPGTHCLTTPFLFFPVMPSMLTLPESVASSKFSSGLMHHSLRWVLSAHGTRKPALLHPQNLLCACNGVSPKSCASLGTMPYLATLLTTAPNCQIVSCVPGSCVLRSTIAFCHVHCKVLSVGISVGKMCEKMMNK